MEQHSNKCLMFGWRVRSIFLIFVVVNNGEHQLGANLLRKRDSRLHPAYLNPDLYREGIASLVNAKERAEELLFKNDIIAQLVTEMPYHEIMQNRLLISGNHKEDNRSFFEKLPEKKKQTNCGKGFDIYKLLNVVQKSRERSENLTQYYGLSSPVTPKTKATTTPPGGTTKSSSVTCPSICTQSTTPCGEKATSSTSKSTMVDLPAFSPCGTTEKPQTQKKNCPDENMGISPSTITYHERIQSFKKFALNKNPSRPEMDSSEIFSPGSDDHLLQQPREHKPPMLIPILENHAPYPLKNLPKSQVGIQPSRVRIESNGNSFSESGYRHFKSFFLNAKHRS